MAQLVPKADKYLDLNKNVLLIGLHGTGKTESVLDLAFDKGIKVALLTCSTLDPHIDLMGIPEFVDTVKPNGTTDRNLVLRRFSSIEDAEFIFFDEINRAAPETMNAILEIVQFQTVKGTKLPNLRCCWAAMNPPQTSHRYQVNDLDHALRDRFDHFVEVKPTYSVSWLADNGITLPVAKAGASWIAGMKAEKREELGYISPRRLYKILMSYEQGLGYESSIPADLVCEQAKLGHLLQSAENARSGAAAAAAQGGIGGEPNATLEYSKSAIKDHDLAVAGVLKANPDDLATHNAVINAIGSCQAGTLARDYAPVLEALRPSILEGYLSSIPTVGSKWDSLTEAVTALPESVKTNLPKLVAAIKTESEHRAQA